MSGLKITTSGPGSDSLAAASTLPASASAGTASGSASPVPAGPPGSVSPPESGAGPMPGDPHSAAADGRGVGLRGQPHDRSSSSAHSDGAAGDAVGAIIVDEEEFSTVPWPSRLHDHFQVRSPVLPADASAAALSLLCLRRAARQLWYTYDDLMISSARGTRLWP